MAKLAKKLKVRAIQRRKTRGIKPQAAKHPIQRVVPDLSLPEKVEQVLIAGDLSPLTPQERVEYHNKVCKSLGLNPLTGPFSYILFRETDAAPAKLQLYATKDCAAQLRKIHRIEVTSIRRDVRDGMSYAEADVKDGLGKRDTAVGVVPLWKWKDRQKLNLEGREYANAIMKTETKAKRRATLSVCGLAFLDESELDTMQVIGGVTRDGRVYEYKQPQLQEANLPELPAEADDPVVQEYERKTAEQLAKVKEEKPQRLGYLWHNESQTATILGSASLKHTHIKLLEKLAPWSPVAKAFVANAEGLDALKYEFGKLNVPFIAMQREAGE